jgi:hypothetical protein
MNVDICCDEWTNSFRTIGDFTGNENCDDDFGPIDQCSAYDFNTNKMGFTGRTTMYDIPKLYRGKAKALCGWGLWHGLTKRFQFSVEPPLVATLEMNVQVWLCGGFSDCSNRNTEWFDEHYQIQAHAIRCAVAAEAGLPECSEAGTSDLVTAVFERDDQAGRRLARGDGNRDDHAYGTVLVTLTLPNACNGWSGGAQCSDQEAQFDDIYNDMQSDGYEDRILTRANEGSFYYYQQNTALPLTELKIVLWEQAGGSGDPHINGFNGQHFDIIGKANTTYSLLTDDRMQLAMETNVAFFDHSAQDTALDSSPPLFMTAVSVCAIDASGVVHEMKIMGDLQSSLHRGSSCDSDDCPLRGLRVEMAGGRDGVVHNEDVVQLSEQFTLTAKNTECGLANPECSHDKGGYEIKKGRVIFTTPFLQLQVGAILQNNHNLDRPVLHHLDFAIEQYSPSGQVGGILGSTLEVRYNQAGVPILVGMTDPSPILLS